jgi:putative ABC transport system permease protein
MFANHLKLAFRNITRQKFYSFINILGLAIGLAICLLILLFIKDELSYDKHHSKADRIYRTLMVWGLNQDGGTRAPINPYKLQPAMKIDFPELEHIIRLSPAFGSLVTYEDQNYQEQNWFFADPEIFEVFDYELVAGNKNTCLNDPFTVILSESTAKKYFGNDDPIDKVLTVNNQSEARVTGVFKDMPQNSHFTTDALISMETGKSIFNQLVLNNWGEGSCYTYLVLPEGKTEAEIEARFPEFIEKNVGEGSSERIGIDLQKMTDIHLHSNLRGEIQANSDIRYIYISSAIALFIILLACINYMNLATARSVKRAMEIGVRKTLGAPKSSLVRQFLSESILVAIFALIVAFLLAQLALPAFNDFMDKSLTISSIENLDIIGLFLGITLLVGLIAGSYPAFYLSSFQAIKVFRENFSKGSSAVLRKFLVVFQFGISIILILATIVVYQQWNFLQNKEIGLNRENLVMVPMPNLSQYQALKNQLEANPNIISVGASNKRLTGRLSSNLGFKAEQYEPDPNVGSSIKIVTNDMDFLKTIEVKMAEGRFFSEEFGSDDTSAFILNQAAVKMIGWEEPIGKWFETSEFNAGTWVTRKGNIIGVVEDYNHESLYEEVKPACYFVSKSWLNWITIRISGQNVTETLAAIKENWTQYASEELYSYQFMDDQIAQLYQTEERFFNLFTFFTMLAIFIAGLGIFGLSAFMAEQRTKEIGVRKVFGASTGNIVLLLSKEFTRLVFIGFLIAAPIGWFFMNNWLQDFVYRINIGWLPFVGAGLLALALAWFTAGFQSFKAAIANPIKALRYE